MPLAPLTACVALLARLVTVPPTVRVRRVPGLLGGCWLVIVILRALTAAVSWWAGLLRAVLCAPAERPGQSLSPRGVWGWPQ